MVFCLHGGAIPPAYLEVVLRREGQVAPLPPDELTVDKANEILACLTGEAMAREQKRLEANGG